MACLGKNHPFNCSCGFGTKGVRPILEVEEHPSFANISAGSHCGKCGALVYFRRAPSGGGTFFDQLGGNWPVHRCNDRKYKYTPFNRHNRPKLRNRKSDLQRRGFIPIIIADIASHQDRLVLRGSWLSTPSQFYLTVADDLLIDTKRSIFMKKAPSGMMVLNCFALGDQVSRELIAEYMVEET